MEIEEGYAKEVTELLMLYGRLLEKHITALAKPICLITKEDVKKEDIKNK